MRLFAEAHSRRGEPDASSRDVELLFKCLLGASDVVNKALMPRLSRNLSPLEWAAWEVANLGATESPSPMGLFARAAALYLDDPQDLRLHHDFVDVRDELGKILGVDALTYLSFLVGVYALWHQAPRQQGAIRLSRTWDSTVLSAEDLEKCRLRAGRDVADLGRAFLQVDKRHDRPLSVLPFRKRPLVYGPDDTVFVPSGSLLLAHVHDGLFHPLWKAHYELERKNPANKFSRFYGVLLERWVRQLLEATYGSGSAVGHAHFPGDETVTVPAGTAPPDAIIELSEGLIFVEVTSSRLKQKSLAEGDTHAVATDIKKCVVNKAKQLNRWIDAYRCGALRLREQRADTRRPIIPIVVTADHAPAFAGTHEYVAQKTKEKNLLKQANLLPLQVMRVEELETLMAHVDCGHSIWQMVERKLAGEDAKQGPVSYATFLSTLPAPEAYHPVVVGAFERFFGEIAPHMFGQGADEELQDS
jgi:transposase-like protein